MLLRIPVLPTRSAENQQWPFVLVSNEWSASFVRCCVARAIAEIDHQPLTYVARLLVGAELIRRPPHMVATRVQSRWPYASLTHGLVLYCEATSPIHDVAPGRRAERLEFARS